MKLAIIGSREFDKETVFRELNKIKVTSSLRVVSGGAKGVDSYAAEWCKRNKVIIEVIRPINPKNKLDYLFRNVEIISKADMIYVFWNGLSRGSKFVIDYAKARKKDIKVIMGEE